MRKIEQARYYGYNDTERNQPKNVTMMDFVSGAVFKNKYPIVQLGIQTMSGVKFYINNSIEPIIVGSSGVYDIELDGIAEINQLSFDAESMNRIRSESGAYLIVDYIYES